LLTAAATSVSIYSPELTTELGQEITLSAMITAVRGSPTGTVSFDDGSTVLGTVPVNSKTDHAIFDIDTLSAGTHKIDAVYSGSSLFAPSKSSVLKETVDGPTLTTPSLGFTGGTTIEGGTLFIGGAGDVTTFTGTIINTGGSLVFTPSGPEGATIRLSPTTNILPGEGLTIGAVNLSNNGPLILSQGVTLANPILDLEASGSLIEIPDSGAFAYISGPISFTNGSQSRLSYGTIPDVVRLPEPTAIGALAIAGAGLLIRRKENKRRNKSDINRGQRD
jgi:Big-like domain-containing protein